MAEESSGPGGYIPVPVILEPLDDVTDDRGEHSLPRGDGSSNPSRRNGESASSTNDNTANRNTKHSHNTPGAQRSSSGACPVPTNSSGGQGNLRRRQGASAGTGEESTPLTLRRCIQSPHGGASPDPGHRAGQPPGALLSVEEGDSILDASSREGDNNERARRVSGCSTGSAMSSGTGPRAGHHHHVVVVATPVPPPACGASPGCGSGKNCPGEGQGEGGQDTPQRDGQQDTGDHDQADNQNNSNNNNNNNNDSDDGEDLLFPGFAPKTFYVLDQKNYFRLWCLRCITWPYPFVLNVATSVTRVSCETWRSCGFFSSMQYI